MCTCVESVGRHPLSFESVPHIAAMYEWVLLYISALTAVLLHLLSMHWTQRSPKYNRKLVESAIADYKNVVCNLTL